MSKALNQSALDLDISDILGRHYVLSPKCSVEFDGRKSIDDHLFVSCGYLEIIEDKPKAKSKK
ncbi:hypothetical protein NVP1054O_28 [Vibrio phage 1.054.O._10N.261.52.A1]|nr:hypothetical protein NVP1054O_28 [Vibrio phage 1.054.O._10N.261.52.A1]